MRETPAQNPNKLVAIVLIAVGAFFLLGQVFNFSFFGTLWPIFVLIPGAIFLYAGMNGDERTVGLVIPGTIISGTAAILFYQNLTGHWQSWAYIWSLYPVFVGLALIYMGQRHSNAGETNTGRGLVRFGLIFFVALWLFFEVLIFNGLGTGLARFLIPALLIGAGIYMLYGRGGFLPQILPTAPSREKAKNNGAQPDPLRTKIDETLAEIEEDR